MDFRFLIFCFIIGLSTTAQSTENRIAKFKNIKREISQEVQNQHPEWFDVRIEIKKSFQRHQNIRDNDFITRNYTPFEAQNQARAHYGLSNETNLNLHSAPKNLFSVVQRAGRMARYLEDEKSPLKNKNTQDRNSEQAFINWKKMWIHEIDKRIGSILKEIDVTVYRGFPSSENASLSWNYSSLFQKRQTSYSNSKNLDAIHFRKLYMISHPWMNEFNFRFSQNASEIYHVPMGKKVLRWYESILLSRIWEAVASGKIKPEFYPVQAKILTLLDALDKLIACSKLVRTSKAESILKKIKLLSQETSYIAHLRADDIDHLMTLPDEDTNFITYSENTSTIIQTTSNDHAINRKKNLLPLFEILPYTNLPSQDYYVSTVANAIFDKIWVPLKLKTKNITYTLKSKKWLNSSEKIFLPTKDRHKLAHLELRSETGYILSLGEDYTVHTNLEENLYELKVHANEKVNLVATFSDKPSDSNIAKTDIQLSSEILKIICTELSGAGLNPLAAEILEASNKQEMLNLQELENLFSSNSLYTMMQRNNKKSKSHKKNRYSSFTRYLNHQDILCIQCSGASVLFESVLKHYQELQSKLDPSSPDFSKVELVVGYLSEGNTIHDLAHQWVRVWDNQDSPSYIDVDSTPTKLDPESEPPPRSRNPLLEPLETYPISLGEIFQKSRKEASSRIESKSKERYAKLSPLYRQYFGSFNQDPIQMLAQVEQVIRKFGTGKTADLKEAKILGIKLTGMKSWTEIMDELIRRLSQVKSLPNSTIEKTLSSKMNATDFYLWLDEINFELDSFKQDIEDLSKTSPSEWMGNKYCKNIFK